MSNISNADRAKEAAERIRIHPALLTSEILNTLIAATAADKEHIKELLTKLNILHDHAHYKEENEALKKRIKELEDKIEVHENYKLYAMKDDAKCDQGHCKCVPLLKERIGELEIKVRKLQIDLGESMNATMNESPSAAEVLEGDDG
jgi:polyhydroxyalkanoate synthesis regulator phasin